MVPTYCSAFFLANMIGTSTIELGGTEEEEEEEGMEEGINGGDKMRSFSPFFFVQRSGTLRRPASVYNTSFFQGRNKSRESEGRSKTERFVDDLRGLDRILFPLQLTRWLSVSFSLFVIERRHHPDTDSVVAEKKENKRERATPNQTEQRISTPRRVAKN